MEPTPNPPNTNGVKITYTVFGNLAFRGRLLRQVATLQAAGFDCRVVFGDRGDQPFQPENFNFPVEVIPTPFKGSTTALFLRQLRFGYLASQRIARSDATHVVSLSLESLLAGALAKRKRPDLKLIFDSNELHIESYINPVKKRLWAPIQSFCIPYCDAIMHAEGNRLEYFKQHHDPTDRTHFLLENFPSFVPQEKLAPQPARPPVRVLYVGVLGLDRYTLELVDIFRGLAPEYTLDLVGPAFPEFRQELDKELERNPAPNITVKPAIPPAGMSHLIRNYHVGIALYKNNCLGNYYCAPNKVYDYLMNGVPVVANDYPGLRKVLEDGRLGACIQEVDRENFRTALGRIAGERRWDNITEEVRHRYSWEAQAPGFLALFE